MSEAQVVEQDPVLRALAALSDAATSSANHLTVLNEDLAAVRAHRMHGWSWRRILADADLSNLLSSLTKVAADLARACGAFRRALALGLRREGMQVTEIASLFDVSRQRVSALLRPGLAEGEDDSAEEDAVSGLAKNA
jgi:predicted XRE-type DNA-binding protein